MEYKKLGDICDIASGGTPLRSKLEYWSDGTIPWLKITNIKEKYISKANEYITQSGLDNSSAKMFSKGTVLYTIFATLGEVGILDFEASTNQAIAGIKVKDDDKLNREYLYYFLKSKKNYVNGIGRGVAQNNINMSILRNFKIPLPNLSVQNKIVNVLNRVSNVIEWRKNQISKYDELIKARFVEMFGDPITNSRNLPVLALSELGEFGRGVSKHRPRNAPELLGGKYPLIQTGEIANSGLYIEKYENTYSELGYKQSKMWQAGTLCITIAANIAKTSILTFDACFPDSVIGFCANDKTNNIFMHYWFSFFQEILENQAPASAQKNINLHILNRLKVIVPSIELQNQFADFVKQIDKSKFVDEKNLIIMCKIKRSLYYDQF